MTMVDQFAWVGRKLRAAKTLAQAENVDASLKTLPMKLPEPAACRQTKTMGLGRRSSHAPPTLSASWLEQVPWPTLLVTGVEVLDQQDCQSESKVLEVEASVEEIIERIPGELAVD